MPTGIDRVCLAYVSHFGDRADAVLQWKGKRLFLSGNIARRMMALLAEEVPAFRWRLVVLLARALSGSSFHAPRRRQLYLNVGHTGLNDPGLTVWIAKHDLRAIHLIHDLIPIAAPEYCRPGEAERHACRMTNALTSASGVIGNSRATLDEVRAFAATRGLPCPPMIANWLAGDALPTDVPPVPDGRPYFIVLGTIEGRKNHLLLLQLWKRLAERMGAAAPRLLLVGQRGWEADSAFAMLDRCPILKGVVIELNRCSDDELAGLVKGARALLMPSFVEGFGMPVIEALRLGTPVIASDLPVFREIAGDIPTYLPAHDAVGWERAVLDFIGPSAERARQVLAARDYRAPDWQGHFADLEQWLATIPT